MDLKLPEAEDFDSPNGKGVTGRIDGQRVPLGNRLLMEAESVDTADFEGRLISSARMGPLSFSLPSTAK